jgi:outer membrane biosynthesis protein TonB
MGGPVGVEEESNVERSSQRGFGPEEGDTSSFGMVNLSNPKSSIGNSTRSLTVRFDATRTQGGLDGNVVHRILRQGLGAFRNCYQNVLMQSSKAEGAVTVAFEIDEQGSVSQPTVLESDFKDPVMTPCVVSVISSLAFPKPDRLPAKVTVPILFSK